MCRPGGQHQALCVDLAKRQHAVLCRPDRKAVLGACAVSQRGGMCQAAAWGPGYACREAAWGLVLARLEAVLKFRAVRPRGSKS